MWPQPIHQGGSDQLHRGGGRRVASKLQGCPDEYGDKHPRGAAEQSRVRIKLPNDSLRSQVCGPKNMAEATWLLTF